MESPLVALNTQTQHIIDRKIRCYIGYQFIKEGKGRRDRKMSWTFLQYQYCSQAIYLEIVTDYEVRNASEKRDMCMQPCDQ